MDTPSLMFLGVGVALSVLGFFLKREARKACENDKRISDLEVQAAKNEVRDAEKWQSAEKSLEDRRQDIKLIFQKLEEKARRKKK